MANPNEWSTLINPCAHELAERWDLTALATPTLVAIGELTTTTVQQTHTTAVALAKSEVEMESVHAMLKQLRDQNEALEQAFARIDQLETIVETVKKTYNNVAASVDTMERVVATSSRTRLFGLSLGKPTATPFQPYFPPPPPVEIYSTKELFKALEEGQRETKRDRREG
ncbi:hypothetical protein BDF14DRAFT_1879646 [Spinellus fusiger]|nr:hypothetical protein BDF14DRAFT_1879646 [Spinellus fusiger]